MRTVLMVGATVLPGPTGPDGMVPILPGPGYVT